MLRSKQRVPLKLKTLESRTLLTFTPAVDYAGGDRPRGLAVADFNNDGALDLAVPHERGGWVDVLLGNGDGTFRLRTRRAVGNGG